MTANASEHAAPDGVPQFVTEPAAAEPDTARGGGRPPQYDDGRGPALREEAAKLFGQPFYTHSVGDVIQREEFAVHPAAGKTVVVFVYYPPSQTWATNFRIPGAGEDFNPSLRFQFNLTLRKIPNSWPDKKKVRDFLASLGTVASWIPPSRFADAADYAHAHATGSEPEFTRTRLAGRTPEPPPGDKPPFVRAVYKGMETPWGRADSATNLISHLGSVSTPSHGGIRVMPERNALIPEYMREPGGFYEEDCDWAIPFVVFEEELLACGDSWAAGVIGKGEHKRSLRQWHPDAYERFFGETIPEGESHIKDERAFYERHASDLITVAAYGDYDNAPAGTLLVAARVGGHGGAEGPTRHFLVPEAEYDARPRFGMVIDPDTHAEVHDPLINRR